MLAALAFSNIFLDDVSPFCASVWNPCYSSRFKTLKKSLFFFVVCFFHFLYFCIKFFLSMLTCVLFFSLSKEWLSPILASVMLPPFGQASLKSKVVPNYSTQTHTSTNYHIPQIQLTCVLFLSTRPNPCDDCSASVFNITVISWLKLVLYIFKILVYQSISSALFVFYFSWKVPSPWKTLGATHQVYPLVQPFF